MVTTEIKNLREKLQALNYKGVALVAVDIFEIIARTLTENTGLKIKQDGKEVIAHEFVLQLKKLYQIQLEQLLKDAGDEDIYQRDIEDEIRERKEEEEGRKAA